MGASHDHQRLGRERRLVVHELGQRILRRREFRLGRCQRRAVVGQFGVAHAVRREVDGR